MRFVYRLICRLDLTTIQVARVLRRGGEFVLSDGHDEG